MRLLACALALGIGCGSTTSATSSSGPPRPPSLDDLAWLIGTWSAPGSSVSWDNVAGAMYGVSLRDDGFELSIIDDNDDAGHPTPVTMIAMTDGRDPMSFTLTKATRDGARFASSSATVQLAKAPHGMTGTFTHLQDPPVTFTLAAAPGTPAKDLEEIDRKFDLDSAARGADAWVEMWAPTGGWGEPRIEGADAIRAAVTKRAAKGSLRWKPTTSGVRGGYGFTLGTWIFGEGKAHGSYVTIWQRQPDNAWKVLYDTGRTEP